MVDKKCFSVNRDILIYAFRYALGRMSYAPSIVTDAVKDNIDNISSEDIRLYIKEIYDCEGYGIEFDKEHWLNFAKYLEDVLQDRDR